MIVWILVAIGVIWLYTQHLSPKAIALKEARKLFVPFEVEQSMEKFGSLCGNLIIATPKSKQNSIEICIYIGQCVGDKCSIRLSFSNFAYSNIRDMLPAYLYAERLGWHESNGLLEYKSDTIEIGSEYDYITYGKAYADRAESAYRSLIRAFLNHCPSVRQLGNDCVNAEGVFQRFKVVE